MRDLKYYPFLELNLAFILMSTSGLFGKIITLPAPLTICLRCLIAGALLLVYLRIRGGLKISWQRDKKFFLLSSVLLAIHWVSYFQAVKMSGVALAMLALFTYPILTSILEPIFFRTNHSWFDIFSSLLVLAGLGLIVPEFSLSSKSMQGVLLGLLSSGLYAIRNILNRKQIVTYSGTTIMCYQLVFCTLLLSPVLFIYPLEISPVNWGNLVLLALITTAIAHTLFVKGLANFTASTVSILSCLTPIYGILWAVWLTDEQLNQSTIIGGTIIVVAGLAQSYRHYQKKPHVTETVQ